MTKEADMRAVFEASCQRMYGGIMNQIASRAAQGMGGVNCVWIEADHDGPLGQARERVIVERLEREGYAVHKRVQGAQSYVIRWCEDRSPWSPEMKVVRAATRSARSTMRSLKALMG